MAPAKRDSEVSKVAAHAPLLCKTSRSAPCRIGVLISERDMRVNEITDRLHPSPAGRGCGLFVTGKPGIGKARWADAFLEQVRSARTSWMRQRRGFPTGTPYRRVFHIASGSL